MEHRRAGTAPGEATPSGPLLWTARQLADELQCAISLVYLWARLGQIPSVRLGRAVRFPRLEIETWLSDKVARQGRPPARQSVVDGGPEALVS